MTTLDEKICHHHSLKDHKVHTDGAWWKLEQLHPHTDIGSYSQGYMVCLEPF